MFKTPFMLKAVEKLSTIREKTLQHIPGYRSPVPPAKFQMAPTPSTVMSSRSKKKEPRCICLSEAKASHSHNVY
jgi:hypothetical protein